jgi:hypothetical protein
MRNSRPRRTDALYLDVYIRWVLSRLNFGGARVSDDQLRELARTKWGRYQGYAGFYLATDTDAWANDIGARPLGVSRASRFGAGYHAIAGAS